MLARARLPPADAAEYELNHFVPLTVGGHPVRRDNLWQRRWDGAWNARAKTAAEASTAPAPRAQARRFCKGSNAACSARSPCRGSLTG